MVFKEASLVPLGQWMRQLKGILIYSSQKIDPVGEVIKLIKR